MKKFIHVFKDIITRFICKVQKAQVKTSQLFIRSAVMTISVDDNVVSKNVESIPNQKNIITKGTIIVGTITSSPGLQLAGVAILSLSAF